KVETALRGHLADRVDIDAATIITARKYQSAVPPRHGKRNLADRCLAGFCALFFRFDPMRNGVANDLHQRALDCLDHVNVEANVPACASERDFLRHSAGRIERYSLQGHKEILRRNEPESLGCFAQLAQLAIDLIDGRSE